MTNTPGDGPNPNDEPYGEAGRPEHPAEDEPGYWEQQARRQEQEGGQPGQPGPQTPGQPGPQASGQPGPQVPGQPAVPYPPYPPPGYSPGYPPGYPQGPVQYAPDHPRATTSLVLGILSIVACQVLGPVAWWMGKKTLDEIDASGGRYGGRGAAQAGYVMGVVGTVLLALVLVFLVVYVVFFVAIIGGTTITTG